MKAKNFQRKEKFLLTNDFGFAIIIKPVKNAGVAQSVEQLICNQQVGGSSPSTSSTKSELNMGEFPSGQRGQTVNLLAMPSVVRIHLPPPKQKSCHVCGRIFRFVFYIFRFSVFILHFFDKVFKMISEAKG